MGPSFLVVRLSSLGDLVHTLPAVSALRRGFPDSRIDWLVERRHSEVLRDNPDIDEVIEVDTLAWRRRLLSRRTWSEIRSSVRRIRARRYDAVLDLQGTIKSSVSSFLAKGNRRIGFADDQLKERVAGWLYTERVHPNGNRAHAIDRHLYLLTALGIESDRRSFPIAVSEEVESVGRATLSGLGLTDFVVVNPGGSWTTKRWSPEKFGALAAAIYREWKLPTLITWGPGEQGLAREVAEASASAAQVAPATSLREMMPLVRKARLLVSGDTGPMHVASALGVPVVGIFGPTDPARNGPFGEADEVVLKTVACGPCYKQRCPGFGNVCMTSIEVEDVLSAVRRKLGSR
ncbi:MAG TPA: lipopolysaccharide heptosyltransferase I [Vicinamibacteria bacterium]|nr:lipopolysaccharide heptosyltransferase I [Vicinamibacteria bacterium]